MSYDDEYESEFGDTSFADGYAPDPYKQSLDYQYQQHQLDRRAAAYQARRRAGAPVAAGSQYQHQSPRLNPAKLDLHFRRTENNPPSPDSIRLNILRQQEEHEQRLRENEQALAMQQQQEQAYRVFEQGVAERRATEQQQQAYQQQAYQQQQQAYQQQAYQQQGHSKKEIEEKVAEMKRLTKAIFDNDGNWNRENIVQAGTAFTELYNYLHAKSSEASLDWFRIVYHYLKNMDYLILFNLAPNKNIVSYGFPTFEQYLFYHQMQGTTSFNNTIGNGSTIGLIKRYLQTYNMKMYQNYAYIEEALKTHNPLSNKIRGWWGSADTINNCIETNNFQEIYSNLLELVTPQTLYRVYKSGIISCKPKYKYSRNKDVIGTGPKSVSFHRYIATSLSRCLTEYFGSGTQESNIFVRIDVMPGVKLLPIFASGGVGGVESELEVLLDDNATLYVADDDILGEINRVEDSSQSVNMIVNHDAYSRKHQLDFYFIVLPNLPDFSIEYKPLGFGGGQLEGNSLMFDIGTLTAATEKLGIKRKSKMSLNDQIKHVIDSYVMKKFKTKTKRVSRQSKTKRVSRQSK
jgi:hypothetical protein